MMLLICYEEGNLTKAIAECEKQQISKFKWKTGIPVKLDSLVIYCWTQSTEIDSCVKGKPLSCW